MRGLGLGKKDKGKGKWEIIKYKSVVIMV